MAALLMQFALLMMSTAAAEPVGQCLKSHCSALRTACNLVPGCGKAVSCTDACGDNVTCADDCFTDAIKATNAVARAAMVALDTCGGFSDCFNYGTRAVAAANKAKMAAANKALFDNGPTCDAAHKYCCSGTDPSAQGCSADGCVNQNYECCECKSGKVVPHQVASPLSTAAAEPVGQCLKSHCNALRTACKLVPGCGKAVSCTDACGANSTCADNCFIETMKGTNVVAGAAMVALDACGGFSDCFNYGVASQKASPLSTAAAEPVGQSVVV